MMIAVFIVAGLMTYTGIGSATGCFCVHRYEKHWACRGRQIREYNTCDECCWEFLGVIWPLYWTWFLFGKIFMLPARAGWRLASPRKKPELPEARVIE